MPKGSFYYYFESKEDFGLQVLDRFIARNKERLARFISDETTDPLTRLHNYFDWYADYLASMQCSQGCLLGNLGQKLPTRTEASGSKLTRRCTIYPAPWRAA